MATELSDLDDLEVAFLGVLSLGLPPSRAAGDETFRADHCTAVVLGLWAAGEPGHFLAADGPALIPAFRDALAAAIATLTGRGVLTDQAAGMPAAPGGFEAGLLIDLVNPDIQPVVLDRWLAQQCMEKLLSLPAVYPFLMERYARAGEFWRKAREGGYAV